MRVIIHQIGPRDGEVMTVLGVVKEFYLVDGVPYRIEEYASESPDRETRFALVQPGLMRKMLGT